MDLCVAREFLLFVHNLWHRFLLKLTDDLKFLHNEQKKIYVSIPQWLKKISLGSNYDRSIGRSSSNHFFLKANTCESLKGKLSGLKVAESQRVRRCFKSLEWLAIMIIIIYIPLNHSIKIIQVVLDITNFINHSAFIQSVNAALPSHRPLQPRQPCPCPDKAIWYMLISEPWAQPCEGPLNLWPHQSWQQQVWQLDKVEQRELGCLGEEKKNIAPLRITVDIGGQD